MHRHTRAASAGLTLRRGATLAAGLAIAVGSINLAAMTSASAVTHAATPTISLDLPGQLGNGGDLQSASATINNSNGADIAAARVDFTISDDANDLTAADFVANYLNPATSAYDPITLSTNADGTVSGFFGPSAGFAIPAGYDATTPLQIATNPGAPSASIKVAASLDTVPGDTTSSVSTATSHVSLSTPSIAFTDYPASLPAGGDYVAYTGTLTNGTGSNYGGATATNSPTPAGVRVDFSTTSTPPGAVKAADLSLQYCLGGDNTEACTGGTWSDIPLSDSNGAVVGSFGPNGGFSLPNGASNTTAFRIKALAGTPKSGVTTTVDLDKVDSAGSDTTTDSSGVMNGTISSTTLTSAVQEPTMTFSLPDSIGNGGDLMPASVTIDNTGGVAMSGVRVDLTVTPNSPTAALDPSDFVIKLDTGGGNYVPVTLTSDGNGGLKGNAPPDTGFDIDANHSDTSNLLVGSQPTAPVGSVTFGASLDTTPGDATTSIATFSKSVSLAVPALSFGANYPTTVGVGSTTPAEFTATLDNTTGSNYGGASEDTAPTVAGLREKFSISSSVDTVPGSDVVLQYCTNATSPTDVTCAGGTWVTIPLTGTGLLTGSFGPTGGFALPAGGSEPLQLRVRVLAGTPATTLTPTVTLDKVDATTGADTGTDSSGVNNGTITSVTGTAITVTAVRNPKITATLKSAHAKTAAGWYRSAVTVTWHCTSGSAALTKACPAPTVVTGNSKGHVVTKTIKATDGGTATLTETIKIDHTAPSLTISGVVNGHTYASKRTLKAHCSDSLSGVKSCTVTSHKSGHTVTYKATAIDKAGNVTTKSGKYKIS